MNIKHTESEKTSIIARYHAGETVAAISSDTGIPRSTIYDWLKDEKAKDTVKKTLSINGYRLLENKVSRLQGIIEILKKVECSANDPLDVRLSALEALQSQYSVRILGMLNAARSFVWKYSAFTTTAIRYLVPERFAL